MSRELTIVHAEDLKLLSKYTDDLDIKIGEFLYRNEIEISEVDDQELGDVIFNLQEIVDRLRS